MAYYFRRSILLSHHATRQARNSNPVLQSSLSRVYTNSKIPSPPPNTPSQELPIGFVVDKYLGKFEKAVKRFAIGTAIFVPSDLIFAWCLNIYNEYKLNKTLEEGTQPDVKKITKNEFVPRTLITERLKKILVPSRNQSFYYVVCGEHGTGKTTLMRIASREAGEDKKKGIQGGRGVIYVDIPPDVEGFGKKFGEALNFKVEERISCSEQLMKKMFGITNREDSNPKWKRALEAFKRASAEYIKKNPCRQPPVIVYDNISRLIHADPKILDFLQDDAKDNADFGNYIAVFVCSEGSVPRRMESRSSWSRAKPVIEIGDLSKEESIEYLSKRGVREEDAKRFYGLVGGRIIDLKYVADESQTFEVIKEQVFKKIYDNLEKAEMNPFQPNHEAAKIIIRALLNSNDMLHVSMLREMTKVEPSKLLEGNVFAYHPENKTVTFQSLSTECYIRAHSSKFVDNKKRFLFF